MNRFLLLASVGTLVTSTVAVAQETKTVEATLKVVDTSSRRTTAPVSPVTVRVALSSEAPANVTLPDDLQGVLAGTGTVGARQLAVAIGKSDDVVEHPDMMCIDLNADGKFSPDEHFAVEAIGREQGGRQIITSGPIDIELPSGATGQASYMLTGGRNLATLVFAQYLEARTEVAGAERVIAVVDHDLDGKFGSEGDLWTLASTDGRPTSEYGLSSFAERLFVDGQLVGVSVADASVELRTEKADGPDPQSEASHRQRVEHLWASRFDAEREQFVAQRGLDTSRPLAEKPVDWKYVSFDEAIQLGKEAGKPVFIDVMAFWCVWCYRMDYYTYPDAEVARLLSEDFIPVKIVQEQDRAGDYQTVMSDKLQARGIPAMGVFNAEGEVVHTIGGWKKAEDFVKELNDAKAKLKD